MAKSPFRLKEIEMPMVSEGNTVISMTPKLKCFSGCVLSGQPNTSLETKERHKSVMLVVIIGGVKANSLAVMSDAAHLLTDVAGFSMSIYNLGFCMEGDILPIF